MSTCNENRSRSRKNSACSTCALQASSWLSVRYHCCNWYALTRTRGVRLALRSTSSRHAATKRRPRRSQSKSFSNYCANACSLPGRQSIGDQHQRPIAQPHRFAAISPRKLIEHRLEAELAPHRTRGQHRPPVLRADRADIIAPDAAIVDRFPVQQAAELVEVEMRCQKIAATEIDDGAMLRLAVVVAIGFDHAHVFALHVLADVRPDHSQEHPATRGNGKTCPCEFARCSLRFATTKPTKKEKSLSLQIDENRYSPLTTSITYGASSSPKCQTWASSGGIVFRQAETFAHFAHTDRRVQVLLLPVLHRIRLSDTASSRSGQCPASLRSASTAVGA